MSTEVFQLVWRGALPETLVWAEWDGQFVVYHRPSGRTHFLNRSSHRLVTEILSEPTTGEKAVQALCALDGNRLDESEMLGTVAETILRLEEIGLIERD